jgi:hypothetical protein
MPALMAGKRLSMVADNVAPQVMAGARRGVSHGRDSGVQRSFSVRRAAARLQEGIEGK